jgi:hypothetical protein
MKILIILSLLFPCLMICAQTTKSEVLQDIRQTGGINIAVGKPEAQSNYPLSIIRIPLLETALADWQLIAA